MDKEKIFLETLNDIRERIKDTFLTLQNDKIKPDKGYDLIKACGLLRHLLVDSPTLTSQVNMKYRTSIIFKATDTSVNFPNNYDQFWFSLIPTPYSYGEKTYRLNEFLKIVPLGVKEHHYSVLDIIKTCSHVLGGVHTRDPADEKEKSFVYLTKDIDNGVYMSIYSISKVCLAGLSPLEEKVRAHTSTSGF